MRVLQVGAGRWGRKHLRCWRRLGVDVVVCDSDSAALEALDPPTTRDYRGFLDRVDAVDVVTPVTSHAGIVRDALECGRDVFVEKPFTIDPEEAFTLDGLARARGAILQVGHVFRFAPEARVVAEAIRQGRIGRPRYLSGHFMGFKRPRSDGGAVSQGIHWVDLASWVLGKPPVAVSALLRDCFDRSQVDVALLDLDYGGEFAHVEASYFPPEPRRDLIVIGAEGAIVCDFLAENARVRAFGHAPPTDLAAVWSAEPGEAEEVLPVTRSEPLLDELASFVEACRSRRPSPVAADGFAGAVAVAVVAASERSAREGRRVELKLPTPASEAPRG
jgi:UDP-2-acetamido-3-amino-2,3-dideoxy-glucuronate N-acetyltransferase